MYFRVKLQLVINQKEKEMNTETSGIIFCKGGVPKSPKSNRMAELAPVLGAYEFESATIANFQEVLENGNLEAYKEFFEKCQKYNVHIVGSRDTVYRSSQMVVLIDYLIKGDPNVLRAIPRTMEFRSYAKAQLIEEHPQLKGFVQ